VHRDRETRSRDADGTQKITNFWFEAQGAARTLRLQLRSVCVIIDFSANATERNGTRLVTYFSYVWPRSALTFRLRSNWFLSERSRNASWVVFGCVDLTAALCHLTAVWGIGHKSPFNSRFLTPAARWQKNARLASKKCPQSFEGKCLFVNFVFLPL
jgi:hypothetical protein